VGALADYGKRWASALIGLSIGAYAAVILGGTPEADEPPDTDTDALADALAQRDHARAELDTERRLREAAERNADDLRTALRMLDAGPPTTSTSTPERSPWYRRVLDREAAQREHRTPPPWEH